MQLFETLDSLVDEVRQIEGKVIEISRLQEIFTEKVLEQASAFMLVANTLPCMCVCVCVCVTCPYVCTCMALAWHSTK